MYIVHWCTMPLNSSLFLLKNMLDISYDCISLTIPNCCCKETTEEIQALIIHVFIINVLTIMEYFSINTDIQRITLY